MGRGNRGSRANGSAVNRRAILWLALGLGACAADGDDPAPETPGPLMRPGWNCLASGCHFPDKAPRPPDWTAGGTIYARKDARANDGLANVTVILRDESGKAVRLLSNAAGNFHTAEPLTGSLEVTLEYRGRTKKMPARAPAGSCNFCHSPPPSDAGGRIFAP